jgi:hypothetical protein
MAQSLKPETTINPGVLGDLETFMIQAGEPASRIGLCFRVYLHLISKLQPNGIMSGHTGASLIEEPGLNRHNVSRALSHLESANLIKRGRGKPQSIYLNPRYVTRCQTKEFAKLANNWRLMG